MLHIEQFVLGPLETNAYLLTSEDRRKGIIIDPGMRPDKLVKRIHEMEIEAIVLTHAHFDHIGGVDVIRKLKKCPVYLHAAEADWLTNAKRNGSAMWPDIGGPIETEPAEFDLAEDQQLQLLDMTFHVRHTPGHSPGSVSLWLRDEKIVFGGDVLFRLSVGRTDLPGGSSKQLYESIHEKLFILEPETVVYPGHGAKTTIGYEQANNPYV